MIVKQAIHTDYIRLQDLLKLTGDANTGGQAKLMIQDGMVLINNQVCLERGKKIRVGDIVKILNSNDEIEVVAE
ncbi:MAG: RNA-binding S4 domain-containing protein [Clostridia bacterium]|nr:RNA-binding S4 domain-containing protein [Clostridia bacterium]